MPMAHGYGTENRELRTDNCHSTTEVRARPSAATNTSMAERNERRRKKADASKAPHVLILLFVPFRFFRLNSLFLPRLLVQKTRCRGFVVQVSVRPTPFLPRRSSASILQTTHGYMKPERRVTVGPESLVTRLGRGDAAERSWAGIAPSTEGVSAPRSGWPGGC